MVRIYLSLLVAPFLVSFALATTYEDEAPCFLSIDPTLVENAEAGDPAAQFKLGESLIEQACATSQYEEGLDFILDAAKGGHPPAQFKVGAFLVTDATSESDTKLGLNFLIKSAEAGFVDAQTWLGVFLMSKAEVSNERDQALYWIGSAASQGSVQAAMTAYVVYKEGLHGFSKDACAAALWKEAADIISGQSNPALSRACR